MSSKEPLRKRSTSTLANTISFTHTRTNNANNNPPIEEDHRSVSGSSNTLQRSKTTSFAYLQKNNSSSTVNSISQTLSNVGFNKITPIETNHSFSSSSNTTPTTLLPPSSVLNSLSPTGTAGNSGNTNSNTISSSASTFRNPLSPTVSTVSNSATSNKIENAISRAKLFAKTKTKDLKRSSKSSEEKTHHHHNFLKKNTHTGLSSAQSNSKLETGSTLYSFDPSAVLESNDTVLKHVLNDSNSKSLSFEEKDQIADNLWATLSSTTINLFKVDNPKNLKLKTPIEDVNRMVEVYLKLRIENNYTTTSIISEIMEFLRSGMNILENELSFNENFSENAVFDKIAFTWNYFFKNIYHYILGVFLPFQAEFNHPTTKKSSWNEASTDMLLSSKNIVLSAFRDFVVLPYFENEILIPKEMKLEDRKSLIKCFGMLKSVQSNSYNQKIVEHILMLLLQGLGPL